MTNMLRWCGISTSSSRCTQLPKSNSLVGLEDILVTATAARSLKVSQFPYFTYALPSGSKISLGRVDFQLETLPTFYVAEIQTVVDGGKQCLSRKLRCSAISKFLTQIGFSGPFAVNHNAKLGQLSLDDAYGPIDHFILRCKFMGDIEPPIMATLSSRVFQDSTEKELRRNNGILEERTVNCRFVSGRLVKPNSGDEQEQKLYHRCLATFICTEASKDLAGRRSDANPAHKEWLLSNPSKFHTSFKNEGLAKYCSFRTRAEPVLNLDAMKLHLNLDLVFCLDKKVMVSDLLLEYLGNNLLGPMSAEHLSLITGVLAGQKVRYIDPAKIENGVGPLTPQPRRQDSLFSPRSHHDLKKMPSLSLRPMPSTPQRSPSVNMTAQDTSRNSGSPETKYNQNGQQSSQTIQTYKIQDIRSSAEVSKFVVRHENSHPTPETPGTKPMSVSAYFEKVKKTPLKYPHLPLAQVGQGTWIPLEFLQLEEGQILRHTGHLADFVKVKIPVIGDLRREAKIDMIDEQENVLLKENKRNLPNIFERIQGRYVSAKEAPAQHTPEKPELDFKRAEMKRTDPSLQADLVYIPSKRTGSAESTRFLDAMSKSLHGATLLDFATPEPNPPGEVEEPLLLGTHMEIQDNPEYDVIIGIVDESGRSKTTIDQMRAEIHRYAERQAGCIALCVSKQTLDKSIKAKGRPYIPKGLLYKINLMLGGTNHKFDTEGPLQAIANTIRSTEIDIEAVKDGIIIGAHVSHPGSSAGASCPSAAALVGTRGNALHYAGAARVQPTIRQTSKRKGQGNNKSRTKHVMQSRILGLQAMIKEQMELQKGAASMIFFRHNLDPVADNGIIEKEIDDITAALQTFEKDPEAIQLTNIVVSHNNQTALSTRPEGVPGFAVGPKHWYTVKKNGLQIDLGHLQAMVRMDASEDEAIYQITMLI